MALTPPSSSSLMARKHRKHYRRLMIEKKATIIRKVRSGWSKAGVAGQKLKWSRSSTFPTRGYQNFSKIKWRPWKQPENQPGLKKEQESGCLPKVWGTYSCALKCHDHQAGGDFQLHYERKGRSSCTSNERRELPSSVMGGWGISKSEMTSGTRICAVKAVLSMIQLRPLLQQFMLESIFNCDKTVLFNTVLSGKMLAFADDLCHCVKQSKE